MGDEITVEAFEISQLGFQYHHSAIQHVIVAEPVVMNISGDDGFIHST